MEEREGNLGSSHKKNFSYERMTKEKERSFFFNNIWMDPRAGNWATLATLERYIDYQRFLWKDFHLRGENDGRKFHILRYGEVILGYTGFNLKFRVTKTIYDCQDVERNLNVH